MEEKIELMSQVLQLSLKINFNYKGSIINIVIDIKKYCIYRKYSEII